MFTVMFLGGRGSYFGVLGCVFGVFHRSEGYSLPGFFKNNPLTAGSKSRCENPHLCAYILLHLEELVAMMESERDSVAGLQRFLVAHFPPVVSKIMPEGSPEEIKTLMESEEDFFNDITYDEAVLAVVNPLLVLEQLYEVGVWPFNSYGVPPPMGFL